MKSNMVDGNKNRKYNIKITKSLYYISALKTLSITCTDELVIPNTAGLRQREFTVI